MREVRSSGSEGEEPQSVLAYASPLAGTCHCGMRGQQAVDLGRQSDFHGTTETFV